MKTSLFLFLGLFWLAAPPVDAQVAIRPDSYSWVEFSESFGEANSPAHDKIIVDVFSPNCTWCARMYQEVYSDSLVNDFISNNFVITQLNLEDFETEVSYKEHTLSIAELAYGLGASGTPTTVFLDGEGNYITRLEGFHPVDDFLNVLKFIASEAYTSQSFAEFMDEAAGK